jgi:2-dehydro-3-deoxygluconokinase
MNNPVRMTRPLDVLTFGETMGLFYPEGNRGLGTGGTITQSFGGAESNVAIGLVRLGCRSGWFSLLGDDPLGHGILKAIRGEGVDVSRVRFSREAPTGLMLREAIRGRLSVYYYRAGSAASRMSAADIDASYIASSNILHLTGITPALSLSCLESVRAAIKAAKAAEVKISFDPNLRLKLWNLEQARPVLLELAEAADYFLPGFDELKLLYGTKDEAAIMDHVSRLNAVTVIKSVGQENWLVNGSQVTRVPFVRTERVIDTVGAGDGFCAGFLTGITKGYSLEESVSLATLVGSLVVQAPGDWEALPSWEEAKSLINRSNHIER